MNLNALAIALQGIGFGAAVTAVQGFLQTGGVTTRRGGGIVKRKRGKYEVDAFADWAQAPRRNDDEECLLLMMI